jgi:hypothetical protein
MHATLIEEDYNSWTGGKTIRSRPRVGTMEHLKQAADQTKVVVSLPPKWLNKYGDFITKNAGAVGQVEGALRSLTYIIPGMCRETIIGRGATDT